MTKAPVEKNGLKKEPRPVKKAQPATPTLAGLSEALEELEANPGYQSFKRDNHEYHLAHAFSMHKPGAAPDWQVGLYSPKTGKVVVFKTGPVEQLPAEEAFTKGEAVKRLDLALVTLDPERAEERALAVKEKERPGEIVTKVIVILQHLDRQVYNVTLVTAAFNILNVRVDAASGEVVSSQVRSIMSLRRE